MKISLKDLAARCGLIARRTKHVARRTKHAVAAAAMVTTGICFVGDVAAVEVVVNGSFEESGGWSSFGTYTYDAGPPWYSGGLAGRPPGQAPTDHYYHSVGQPATSFQTINLYNTFDVGDIDAGNANFNFSAYLAGYTPQLDHPEIQLKFYSQPAGLGTQVGSTVIFDGDQFGPGSNFVSTVTGDAPSIPLWKLYENADVVPVGARSARVSILQGTPNSNGNDNYADLISLDITGAAAAPPPTPRITIFSDGFENTVLGPQVDENTGGSAPLAAVWTDQAPTGWNVDNTQMPAKNRSPGTGVTEFTGFNFGQKDWWVSTAGDQQRSLFTLGSGGVAIADPDEWDDISRTGGSFNSFLSTPEITLDGDAATLTLDSSFRPFANQTATIDVSFDGGQTFNNLLTYQGGADLDGRENESLSLALGNGATDASALIRFGLTNAGNDWWWAFDNVQVNDGSVLFSENFDGLTYGPNVQEGNPLRTDVWSATNPDWTVDNSQMPTGGVTEWSGWGFAEGAWWKQVAGAQNRQLFSNAEGTVAIADPDEWDDLAHAAGEFNSYLQSPQIALDEILPGTAVLEFDSSWRPFDDQLAVVEVCYDGGLWEEVLRFESDSLSEFFHPDAENEFLELFLDNPVGAEFMEVRFGLLNAGNDWWWAIDNVRVSGVAAPVPEPASLAGWSLLGGLGLGFYRWRKKKQK